MHRDEYNTLLTPVDRVLEPGPIIILEHDPNGTDQHAPGAKLDAGKPRVGLVLGGFSKALLAVAEVGTAGAAKYSDSGWKTVPNGINRYNDAQQRHWLEEMKGKTVDPESDQLHAAHTAWNALARLELILEQIKTK